MTRSRRTREEAAALTSSGFFHFDIPHLLQRFLIPRRAPRAPPRSTIPASKWTDAGCIVRGLEEHTIPSQASCRRTGTVPPDTSPRISQKLSLAALSENSPSVLFFPSHFFFLCTGVFPMHSIGAMEPFHQGADGGQDASIADTKGHATESRTRDARPVALSGRTMPRWSWSVWNRPLAAATVLACRPLFSSYPHFWPVG
jgi:hypothetical protein